MSNIAVLGRGESLKHYKKYSHMFDKIYLVARFNKEISKIGLEYFKKKKVIHVAARGSHALKYYNKLNIKHVQTACHSIKKEFCTAGGKHHKDKYPKNVELKIVPECMENRGYPPLHCDIIEKCCSRFDSYKTLCSFLEQTMPLEIKKASKTSRRTRYWPTTGIFALDVALTENRLDKIYLFGLDLYTTLSYIVYKTCEFDSPIDTPRTRLAFYHMRQLVQEFSEVNFYCASKAKKFKFNYPNWHLI